jgi:hypothetical protein
MYMYMCMYIHTLYLIDLRSLFLAESPLWRADQSWLDERLSESSQLTLCLCQEELEFTDSMECSAMD